jgi:hypothetical protein
MSASLPLGSPEWLRWDYERKKPMLDEWAAAWARIPPDVQAEIRRLHDGHKYECAGFSEGLWCCVDFLSGKAEESYVSRIGETPPGDPETVV